MKKYIINMLMAIAFATATQAQVPVITTQPNNAIVCKGSTATFNIAASNNPIGYGWEYSNNDGETFVQINSNSVNGFQFSNFNTATIGVLNGTNGFMVRGYAYNASGGSQPSNVALLTVNTATDTTYISFPYSINTCVGYNFILSGSPANGVWSSSNNTVATIGCTGYVKVLTQGTSNIKYIYTATNGCNDTALYSLNSNPPTPAIVSGATSVCVGANTTYLANINGGIWGGNSRIIVNAQTGIATGNSAAATKVIYTLTGANGCISKTEYPITVFALPSVPNISYAPGTVNPQKGAGGAFCLNKTFTVVGTPTGGVWSSTGVISVNSISGVVNTGLIPGVGTLEYTVSNGVCTNKKSISATLVLCPAARGVNTNELENEVFTIYPNPAKSFININSITSSKIFITDMFSKTIKEQNLSLGNNTLDVSQLSKGIYIATVITNNKRQSQKIVIE